MRTITKLALLTSIGLGLSACGGGGSGGSPAVETTFSINNTKYMTSGTGTPDHTEYSVNYNTINTIPGVDPNGNFKSDVQAAHNAGWTGKGFDVEIVANADNGYRNVAPGADFYNTPTGNRSYVCPDAKSDTTWCKDTSKYMYLTGQYRDIGVTAASLIWQKHDTMTGQDLYDVLQNTKNTDGKYSLSRALSPVGQLD